MVGQRRRLGRRQPGPSKPVSPRIDRDLKQPGPRGTSLTQITPSLPRAKESLLGDLFSRVAILRQSKGEPIHALNVVDRQVSHYPDSRFRSEQGASLRAADVHRQCARPSFRRSDERPSRTSREKAVRMVWPDRPEACWVQNHPDTFFSAGLRPRRPFLDRATRGTAGEDAGRYEYSDSLSSSRGASHDWTTRWARGGSRKLKLGTCSPSPLAGGTTGGRRVCITLPLPPPCKGRGFARRSLNMPSSRLARAGNL